MPGLRWGGCADKEEAPHLFSVFTSPDSSSSRLQIVFRMPRKVAASGILVSDSSFRSLERRHGCVDTCTVPQLEHTIQPSSSKTAMVTIQVGGLLG